jgi:glycine cleavage system H protein
VVIIVVDFPDNLKYDKKYFWLRKENDLFVLGIIGSAAALAKEFVFVQLPDKGTIKKGDTLVSLEAMKWSGELESPISGEIVEVHEELFDNPSLINKDPYGAGWIVKMKPSDESEIKGLLSANERQNKK